MKMQHNVAFGRVLRKIRKQQHLSQEELGFDSSLDRTYISLLELGRRSPTLDTMIALCNALDITLIELAGAIQVYLDQQNEA